MDLPRSPGNGTTAARLSLEPLATEGEATPGPDDWNPYEELQAKRELDAFEAEPEPEPALGPAPEVCVALLPEGWP